MFATPWTVDVLPYQAGAVDDYNNPTDAWGNPVSQSVYGWAPAGSNEVNGWRHVVTADLQVFAPPEFTCDPKDRVVVDGKTYEVNGDVEDFNHGPFTFAPGVVVNLNRIEGSQ